MSGPVLHLSLPVRELGPSRQFYVGVLGCPPGRVRDTWMDVWFYGMQLTLHERPDQVMGDDAQGVRHFGATLDRSTFDEVLQRLDAHPVRWISGRRSHRDPSVDGKTNVKIADPSGNVIELKYYGPSDGSVGPPADD